MFYKTLRNVPEMYILVMQRFRVVYRGISHESLVFSTIPSIPRKYKRRVRYSTVIPRERVAKIFYIYHAIENTVARWEGWVWYSWIALINGKVRWNTDEFYNCFPEFYFLWHGIKRFTLSLVLDGVLVGAAHAVVVCLRSLLLRWKETRSLERVDGLGM